MNGKIYEISHPLVQEALARFNRNRRDNPKVVCNLTFERLYELSCNFSIPARDIAEAACISLTQFSRLWEDYLMRLFNNITLAERQQKWIEHQRAEQRSALSHTLPDYPWMEWLATEVRHAGHTIQPIIGKGHDETGPKILRSQVSISGAYCSLCPIRTVKRIKGGHQLWGISHIKKESLDKTPWWLFPIVIPKTSYWFLFMPKETLQTLDTDALGKIKLCVPLLENAGLQVRSTRRLNLRTFRNALHLLPREPMRATG